MAMLPTSCHPERNRDSQSESRRSRKPALSLPKGTPCRWTTPEARQGILTGSARLAFRSNLRLGNVPHLAVIAAVLFAYSSAPAQRAQTQPAPLTITTESLPDAHPHEPYTAKLQASGGIAPLHWSIAAGNLPKGLELNQDTGAITGTAVEPGDFELTVTITDSSVPPRTATKDLKLRSVGALAVAWKAYPRVTEDQINGSLTVSNGTKDPFNLTVIVVAVNEFGKAFALGYQKFDLLPDNKDVEIKFGSSLPRGNYIVHADAIAEVAAKKSIYRDRLHTPRPLVISAPSL